MAKYDAVNRDKKEMAEIIGGNTLNPMSSGTPGEVVLMLSVGANVQLTQVLRANAESLILALPEGGTVRDFVEAAELVPSLRMLAVAVGRSFLADRGYGRIFEREFGNR